MSQPTFCRCCGREDCLRPLWSGPESGGYQPQWVRCLWCGSDTSSITWSQTQKVYDHTYFNHNLSRLGFEGLRREVSHNCQLFAKHQPRPTGSSTSLKFLDVGCLEGAALSVMQDQGYAVHGFDIIPEAKTGTHVTVAPFFQSTLFPITYDSVLCREVIEHVPGWRQLLIELYHVTSPQGLCQIQTPRPTPQPSHQAYSFTHLQVFSPQLLRYELEKVGWLLVVHEVWGEGQLWLCRKG